MPDHLPGGEEWTGEGEDPYQDVAGSDPEENFEDGMRQNAMEFDAQDKDQDNKLDFEEFCEMVRSREEGEHTEEELRERFIALDGDGSGKVDMNEYIRFSLRDALSRSASRVIDLFRKWDDDGSGEINKKEFRRAIRALGFNFFKGDAEIDMVFDDFDVDGSGSIEYGEMNKMLRQGAGSKLDPRLLAGGAGEINLSSKGKHKLRKKEDLKKGSNMLGNNKLDMERVRLPCSAAGRRRARRTSRQLRLPSVRPTYRQGYRWRAIGGAIGPRSPTATREGAPRRAARASPHTAPAP